MIEFFLILTLCNNPEMSRGCEEYRISTAMTEEQCKWKAKVTEQILGVDPYYNLRCDTKMPIKRSMLQM